MDKTDAKRLKALEKENAELKKMDADAMLGMKALKETIEKNSERGTSKRSGSTSRFEEALQPTPSMSLFQPAPIEFPLPDEGSEPDSGAS